MSTATAAACVHCGLPRDAHSPQWGFCPGPPPPGAGIPMYEAPEAEAADEREKLTRTRNDPRQEQEIVEDHARADEFATRGTVMHFLLRLGYYPNNEENAEAILLSIIADAQDWDPN